MTPAKGTRLGPYAVRFAIHLAAALLVVLQPSVTAQTPPVGGARQAPARDRKVAAEGTGVIRGRVTAADTGAPLRRASLTLTAEVLERPMSTVTDAEGRYEFTALGAGRYTLEASKITYVTLKYGQRWAFEAGKPIELADRGALEKVDIALPRGGVISGTVVDDVGEPVALGCVIALRARYGEGKRKLVAEGPWVGTNDLGQYRLFGLQPGSYFVTTCQAPPKPPFDDVPFAPAYYPGTLNPAEAQPVVVRLGEEHSGVVVVQPVARLARVSGIVVDSAGRPFPGAEVQILSTSNSGSYIAAGVKADGSFSVDDIIPGEYRAAAAVQLGPTRIDMRRTDYPLTVTADGRAGLVLQLLEGCHLRGRVVTEDGTTPAFRPATMRVRPVPVSSDLPFAIRERDAQAVVKDDWAFQIDGIAGSIVFTIPTLPTGYMLKSVLLNGRDITDRPVDIKGTNDVAGVEVVLTTHVTEVHGAPVDATGHPVLDYGVVVFADDATLWRYPSRFVATARPDQQGRFRIAKLPPGRYLAVALSYLEEGQEQDPDYLESLRGIATPFALSWGEGKTLDLKVTKPAGM